MIYLILSILLGIIIGIEREWKQKPAGFKTHTFVAFSCCLLVSASWQTFPILGDQVARIIGHILAGIGFIGAGVIFREGKGGPVGVTTAAEIWCSSIVGILCAIKFWDYAVSLTALVVGFQLLFSPIERKMGKQ
ncbi:MgtC/SapB family protein [Patescibacteria group bacterium]|nr:MgtC/SapB family protein [Patescibacteria group bacterium]